MGTLSRETGFKCLYGCSVGSFMTQAELISSFSFIKLEKKKRFIHLITGKNDVKVSCRLKY